MWNKPKIWWRRLSNKFATWIKLKAAQHPKLPRIIKTGGYAVTPIYAGYIALLYSGFSGTGYLAADIIVVVILFIVGPLIQLFADSIKRKLPTLEKLGDLSKLLNEIVDYSPTEGWQNWSVKEWEEKFEPFARAVEDTIELVIADLERKDVPVISRQYHIACNLMVFANSKVPTDKIETILSSVGEDNPNPYDLYNGIDTDETIIGFLLMTGISSKSQKRDYKPSYIRVYDNFLSNLPGAPLLIHRAPEEKQQNIGLQDHEYVNNVQKFDGFCDQVSDEAKDRFFDIFQDRENTIKSFWSIPIYWDSLIIGTLNIESYQTELLLDNNLKEALEYALSIISPIAGTFAYVFHSNFIEDRDSKKSMTEVN
ncbi:hypothetical protein NC796_25955 [Aliifodinibius sp. S!AR15-10]|uniref:hypothetical protein n=1 Tax=Aliifodinibius sp. S!AR15-10 TaxID=2950437 RepID=UPI0028676667|nr:hypothetical protein [Aliifodinibius sp. S!AR15-10]MDR8394615.1 hypothetical protein [Aliifodinibius sp. S!AR15-10]